MSKRGFTTGRKEAQGSKRVCQEPCLGKLFWNGADNHVRITESTQTLKIHGVTVESKIESDGGLRLSVLDQESNKSSQYRAVLGNRQNLLIHRRIELKHYEEKVAEITRRLTLEEMSEEEMEQLFDDQREQQLIVRNHARLLQQMETKTTVGVHYEVATTGVTVVLSPGKLLLPSFLSQTVCWLPAGDSFHAQAVDMVAQTEKKYEELPLLKPGKQRKLNEKDVEWFLSNNYYDKKLGEATQQERVEKFQEWSLAAASGDSYGQNLLGECYYHGWGGVKKDRKKAFEQFQRSAIQNNPWGQNNLALCLFTNYANTSVSARDRERGLQLYKLSAEQGNMDAQFSLALCYKNANGVERDMKLAKEWCEEAAQQGHIEAKKLVKALARY